MAGRDSSSADDAPLDQEAQLVLARAAELEAHFQQQDVGDDTGSYTFNAKQRRRFLAHLAQFGRIVHAAHAAGVVAQLIGRESKRNKVFAEALEEAKTIHKEFLFKEARRRAVDGVVDVVVSAGQVVYIDCMDANGNPVYVTDPNTGEVMKNALTGEPIVKRRPLTRRVYSDRLMELMLKAHISEFRDKHEVEHSMKGGVLRIPAPITEEEWLKRIEKLREVQAQAQLEEPQGTQTLIPGPVHEKTGITR